VQWCDFSRKQIIGLLFGDFPELHFPDIHKHITQRGFDDAMRSAGLNGTVAIPKFSSRFY
jgi:hypothetical protein